MINFKEKEVKKKKGRTGVNLNRDSGRGSRQEKKIDSRVREQYGVGVRKLVVGELSTMLRRLY